MRSSLKIDFCWILITKELSLLIPLSTFYFIPIADILVRSREKQIYYSLNMICPNLHECNKFAFFATLCMKSKMWTILPTPSNEIAFQHFLQTHAHFHSLLLMFEKRIVVILKCFPLQYFLQRI